MAIVPTKYVFIKESNGNVTLETYDGSTLLGAASLNPAKDIRISESYPNSIIIPFNTTGNHIDNKFVSIPWQRIDFVNSVPSSANPASPGEAVQRLGEDFFYSNSGGGERRHEFTGTYSYMAYAPEGSADSEGVWIITRINVAADGSTTKGTATGAWTNRYSLIYT